MAKYAVIVVAGEPYLAGLNSILNALDYYKVKDIDVHICACKNSMQGYYEYVKDKFNFYIEPHYLEDLYGIHDKRIYDHEYIAAKYGIALKIKDRYSAIMHMSGRVCPVNDISKYFEMAANSKFLMCPDNPRFRVTEEEMRAIDNSGDLDGACRAVPLINFVFFYNPKYYVDLLEAMWEGRLIFRNIIESNDDPHRYKPSLITLDDTHLFVKKVWQLGKWKDVFWLPNNLWVSDYGMLKDILLLQPDKTLVYTTGDKLYTSYGRFYYDIHYNIDSPFPETPEEQKHSCIYQNVVLMIELIKFFNYGYKVTLDQIREIPGDYRGILSGIP